MKLRACSIALLLAVPLLGAAHAQTPQSESPAAGTEPPDFWHRDTLTGDWGGLRTALVEQGVAFTASYVGEVWANVQGGIKRGATYDGVFLPQLDVDLDKLIGWHGASMRASMIQGHGPSLSQGWVGNLLGMSGFVVVPPATRLYNFWLQQNLFDDVLSVRLGLMNVDAEFMISPTAGLFMNTTFGWPAWTGFDLPGGGPAYPLSAPAVRVRLQPSTDGPYLQATVFTGDPTGHGGSNSLSTAIPSGTVVSFQGGAFIIAEAGYAVNQGKDAKGPPAEFKLGGWYHTSHRFQDQRYDTVGISLASPASSGVPRDHIGNWGIYAVADAALYQTENGGLSGFVRIGGSPGDRNLLSFYVDGGLTYKGLIPGRGDDTAGIGFAYARVGRNARGLDSDVRTFDDPLYPVRDQEVLLEISYQIQVTPWLTLQPDLQRIFHPGGKVPNADGSIRRDALVLGLRSMLTF